MATTIDELQVLITANAASFNKQLQAVQRQMDAMGNNTGKMGNAMSASFAKMAAKIAIVGVAVKKAFDGMVFSIRQFGDMEQNLGGAKAIFGNYADYLVDKSQKAYKAMGMSANQYLATANKIGAIMQGSGISQSQSLAMTTKWMERAADQASVMGVSLETAMEAITGAAKGNFMMMDNIGVKMNATTLEAYALSKGIHSTYAEMSEGAKVGLMYQMFMEKTSYAAGNFAKEGATTLNGALATLKASFANLAASLGRGLAPALTGIANFMNNYVIPAFQAAIPYVVGFMQAVGSAVSYVMSALGSIFGFTAGGASEAESAMDGVAEAGVEASKSAGGIASGLGGATKAAKKLKGQLAGFDEMNVLQKPEDTSGGGGGGGAGAMPKFDLPKSAMSGLKKFGDEAEKVANRIKKAFDNVFKSFLKGFNFEKIGKAFKRFGDDIDRFLTPAKKILGDVWNYLQPFIHWVGNDLLPAFLNALGGALQFIGSVVGAIWDTALKPLIDLFLVPIAQFTGGVIVGVLNAIGDGLRWIANNEVAVGVITGIVAAFTAYHGIMLLVNTVSSAYQVISGTITAGLTLMNSQFVAATTSIGLYHVGVGAATSATGLAAGAIGILKGAISLLLSPLGLASIAIGGIVTVVGFMTGAFSGATSEKERHRQKTEELRNKMTEEEKQIDRNKDGIIEYTERIKDLTDAKLDAVNSTLTRIRAGKELREAEEKYIPIINDLRAKTTLTKDEQEKLEEAEASLEQAQIRLERATENEIEAKEKSIKKSKETSEHAKRETIDLRNKEISLLNNAKAFDKIEAALNPATAKLETYRIGMNKMATHTVKDTMEIRRAVVENFNKISSTHEAVLDKITGKYKIVSKKVADIGNDFSVFGNNAGRNYQLGIKAGLENNQWLVNNAARNAARGIKNSFNSEAGIRSPSRVMIKQAGFISQGIAIGLEKTMGQVAEKARDMARTISDNFKSSGLSDITPDSINLSNIKPISASISHRLADSLKIESSIINDRPIHLKVDLDGSNIVDTVVKGVNDLSFLRNASVIDF